MGDEPDIAIPVGLLPARKYSIQDTDFCNIFLSKDEYVNLTSPRCQLIRIEIRGRF